MRDNKGQFIKGYHSITEFKKGQLGCNSGHWKGGNTKILRICKQCKDEFRAWNSEIKRGRAKFCSRKCWEDWNRLSNNSSWRGGITPINITIRMSLEYKNWRKQVFERDNYTCQLCGKMGGNLNADHIKPFSLFIELRFDMNNGRTLCVPCHKNTSSYMNPNMKKEDYK